jgi:hypothetical protein
MRVVLGVGVTVFDGVGAVFTGKSASNSYASMYSINR